MMKPILLIIAGAAMLAASHAKADEWSSRVYKTVMNEAGDGYMECAASFTMVAACARYQHSTNDIEAGYRRHSSRAMTMAAISWQKAGLSSKAVKVKSKFIATRIAGRLNGKCVNISVLFGKLGQCVNRLEDSAGYLRALTSIVAKDMK